MTQDRYLDVGGARLRYRDNGEGHAVVLIHGWALDLEMWEPQVTDLARQYRVIRLDRRGFGLSSGIPGIAADAADVQALCRHLGVEQSVLVGMSQGARVLERLAVVAPALIRGLVFDGAPDMRQGGQLTSNDVPLAEYAALVRAGRLEEFRRRWAVHPLTRLVTSDQRMHELVSRMLERYQGNDLREVPVVTPAAGAGDGTDALAAASTSADQRATTRAGSGAGATTGATTAAAASYFPLASLHVPTLILTGDLDLDSRKQAATALARLLPASRRVILPNAGHLANVDNSAAYNEVLLRFLGQATARWLPLH
jgi:3-oxoadipate enol-lactonase